MRKNPIDQRRGPAPRVAEDLRLYAIGDIHGCPDLLAELLAMIAEDRARHDAARCKIVFLGDYIDRGEDSRAVLDLLSADPLDGFETIYLVGNHEDYLWRFLDDTSIGPTWLKYGGVPTFASYGIAVSPGESDAATLHRLQQELRRAVPARHLAFLRALQTYHLEGNYLFVHAGIRPDIPLAAQTRKDFTFSREGFVDTEHDHGHMVVHGHTIEATPQFRGNRIGIDTGAYLSGVLTCLVLQGAAQAVLQT